MSVPTIQAGVVSEEILLVLQQLSPERLQQVMDFAQFLAQQQQLTDGTSDADLQTNEDHVHNSQAGNWVEEASGSLSDVPEFDCAIAYGRAIRAGDYSVLAPSEES